MEAILTHPSASLKINTILRNLIGKEWQGVWILGIPSQNMKEHSGPKVEFLCQYCVFTEINIWRTGWSHGENYLPITASHHTWVIPISLQTCYNFRCVDPPPPILLQLLPPITLLMGRGNATCLGITLMEGVCTRMVTVWWVYCILILILVLF